MAVLPRSSLLIALGIGAASSASDARSAVVDLTASTFDAALADPANDLWLLKFYAPWCGHCKQLAPVLDAVAPALEGKMALGKIDCTQEAKLCKRFDVRGYPTLLVSRNGGELFPYPSRRDAESIVRFAERMSADPVRAVVAGGHEGALREVADGGEAGVGFVAYDPEAGGGDRGGAVALEEALASTPSLRAYRRAARELQGEAAFGMLLSPGEEGLAGFGGRPAGDGFFVAKIERGVRPMYYVPAAGAGGEGGAAGAQDIARFVRENNLPLVSELGPGNFRSIGDRKVPVAIAVTDRATEAAGIRSDALVAELRDFAGGDGDGDGALRSGFLYAQMDGKRWGKFLAQFGVGEGDGGRGLPELFVLDISGNRYWQNSTVPRGVAEFLRATTDGTIEARDQMDLNAGPIKSLERLFLKYMPWSLFGIIAFMLIPFLFLLPGSDDFEETKVDGNAATEGESKKEK